MVGETGETARSTVGEPSAPSTVRSVVVHASGAVCTRRAHVTVPDGNGETAVRIGGLPPTLYAHSLRARVAAGPRGPRVTDIRLDLAPTPRRADELPSLRFDLEDAEDRQARLWDRKERLDSEIEEVAGLRAEPLQPRLGDPPRWAPVESFLALAGFVDTRLGALHQRLRATEDQLAQADHDVDVLRARLDESSTAPSTERTPTTVCAVVTLAFDGPPDDAEPADPGEPAAADDDPTRRPTADASAADTGAADAGATNTAAGDSAASDESAGAATDSGPAVIELEIEVEYHVPGAGWVPTYQLRLDGRSGAGTLVLRACVAQRTGEDWSGVRLGLSTADLLRRADLPELRSLRIGRTQEEPQAPGWREPPAGLADLFAGYDSAAAARPPAPPTGPQRVSAAVRVGSALPQSASIGEAPPESSGYGAAYGDSAAGAAGPVPAPAPGAAPPLPAAGAPDRARRAGPRLPSPGMPEMQHAPGTRYKTAVPGPPPPPPSGPAAPAADMLDYVRLAVAGPDATEGRGTLRPEAPETTPLVAEYRRRADAVGQLARPAHAVDVRTSAGSFDYRFDTAAPADVASDGGWHIVPVGEVPVATESVYVCVPSVDTAVYGTVLVTNTSPHALLAGPADVMMDGDFVLTAALPTLAPGQRQAVGVGVAESVQVARRTHMRESTAGLRSGTTVLDHTVEVEVANRLPYPVAVDVRERVPVSTDKDVRIEEHRARPAWTEPDEPLAGQDGSYVRGARVWHVELEPGRTTTLTGGFEVRLPAGKSVVGGNRRN
jgi:hypothetical protein